MSDPTCKTPPGMIGIFTDKLGRVVETVSDFKLDMYGGYSLREAQTLRVKKQLAYAVVRVYCSDMIMDGFEGHVLHEPNGDIIPLIGAKLHH